MSAPETFEPTSNNEPTTTTPSGNASGPCIDRDPSSTCAGSANGNGTGSTSGNGTGGTSGNGTGSASGNGTGSGGATGDNSGGTGGDTSTPQATVASVDIDAGLSGVNANIDGLGHDLADVSIGLGALNPVLGLVDGLAGGDSGGASMTAIPNAPLLSAAVNADMSGVQAAVDVLGHDTVDASIGLGAVESVLGLADSKLGLVDTASGLADGLLCDIV